MSSWPGSLPLSLPPADNVNLQFPEFKHNFYATKGKETGSKIRRPVFKSESVWGQAVCSGWGGACLSVYLSVIDNTCWLFFSLLYLSSRYLLLQGTVHSSDPSIYSSHCASSLGIVLESNFDRLSSSIEFASILLYWQFSSRGIRFRSSKGFNGNDRTAQLDFRESLSFQSLLQPLSDPYPLYSNKTLWRRHLRT